MANIAHQSTTTTTTEIPFPDLSAIGDAFTQAISYINRQKHADLEAEAQNWLASAGRRIIENVRTEFKNLHKNKDNIALLPAYALEPDEPLTLSSGKIPHALMPYSNQFGDYLCRLLKACGLNAPTFRVATLFSEVYIDIKFPHVSKNRETSAVRNLNLDMDFQKEFFSGLENLKI